MTVSSESPGIAPRAPESADGVVVPYNQESFSRIGVLDAWKKDAILQALRQRDVWVRAPCGNHHYTDGISWPACQPACFEIGAPRADVHAVHLDRFFNTDLLVCAQATSSSNAYAAGSSMILREAIERCAFPWQDWGENLPEAMLAIFKHTGWQIDDTENEMSFRELNLLAALNFIFSPKK